MPKISSVLLQFTDRCSKGGNAANDRVETAANSYIWTRKCRLGGGPDRRCLNGYWTDAARHHRHPPDVGSRLDRCRFTTALRGWGAWHRFDWGLYDQSRHSQRAYKGDSHFGRPVLRDQPPAIDPRRDKPQTNLDPAGRSNCAGRAWCTDASWGRRGRSAQSAARRSAAGCAGGSSSPIGAAGAAVEMKWRTKGREFRPFDVMEIAGVGRWPLESKKT